MSECCFIDQRWNVKVADYEHHTLEKINKTKRPSQISQVSPLDEESGEIEDPNIQVRGIMGQLFGRASWDRSSERYYGRGA